MKKIDATNPLAAGYTANVILIPAVGAPANNLHIAITTATGTRRYRRSLWCPSVRRLCKIIWDAQLHQTAQIHLAMFELGYSANLRPNDYYSTC